MAGRVRVGVGGWVFEPWRGRFYPEGLPRAQELNYAARALTTVEVNSTFYRTQSPATFAKWRDAAPEGFMFALKAPRYATNRTVLAEAGDSIRRFAESGIAELGDRLGPINWQFAPTKRFDPDDIARFLDLLPAEAGGLPLRHALEVRHDSFRTADFVEACRSRGVAIVLAGDAAYPQIPDVTAGFAYLRIMGTSDAHEQGHPPAALEAWVRRARTLAQGGVPDDLATVAPVHAGGTARDVFLYLIAGAKARNPAAALALIERLGD